jgi:hypothetical protein
MRCCDSKYFQTVVTKNICKNTLKEFIYAYTLQNKKKTTSYDNYRGKSFIFQHFSSLLLIRLSDSVSLFFRRLAATCDSACASMALAPLFHCDLACASMALAPHLL